MRSHSKEEIEKRCDGLEIRPLNKEDFEKYHEEGITRNTLRGYTFYLNGEYAGMAGVEYRPDAFFVFSDIVDIEERNKMTIYRCACFITDMLKRMNKQMVAVTNRDNLSSLKFVEACGFYPYAEEGDTVYLCREAG